MNAALNTAQRLIACELGPMRYRWGVIWLWHDLLIKSDIFQSKEPFYTSLVVHSVTIL